jgi:tRNA wybutosine-synthesizing protein 3
VGAEAASVPAGPSSREDLPPLSPTYTLDRRAWERVRRRHLAALSTAVQAGAVDVLALPLLEALNRTDEWVTTSSCSGRIQVLALARAGGKPGSIVLGRWHAPPFDIEGATAAAPVPMDSEGLTALFAEPPIFHVQARSLDAAIRLRDGAERAGFKRSVIRTLNVSSGTIVVEIASTDRLEAPLRTARGGLDEVALRFLAEEARRVFFRGQERLARLYTAATQFK